MKTKQQKDLEGNRGQRPTPDPITAPDMMDLAPPAELPDESKQFWIAHVQIFVAMGVLKAPDRLKFAQYCHACAQWLKLTKQLADQGSEMVPDTNNIDQRVYLRDRHQETVYKLGMLFGDNPTARMKLALKEQDKSDPVQKFLKIG